MLADTTIRKATYDDIDYILELLYDLGRLHPQNDSDAHGFADMVKQYVADTDKEILVAKIGNDIVGMTSMMFLPRLNRLTPEMYIPELIVLPKYQRHGIGNKLMSECVNMAHEKKCHRMRLESGYARTAAHQFYTHLGFVDNARSFVLELVC